MSLPITQLGSLQVSRFIIGGNPFCGFSHQTPERNAEMVAWYTDERVVETLFQAEALGVTTCILRGDTHITRVLDSYWDQGGTMRWVAQADEMGKTIADGAQFCLDHGASAVYLHGGLADHWVAHERRDLIDLFVETVRQGGVPVGMAGHMPADFLWAEEHLDVDFYMVCYYNPSPRRDAPAHNQHAVEQYLEEDRRERVATIARLTRPAIHYKILAAGRNDPEEAFAYAARHLRPTDAVCVGVYTQENPHMLADDVELFLRYVR